jgi:hypothetical protein
MLWQKSDRLTWFIRRFKLSSLGPLFMGLATVLAVGKIIGSANTLLMLPALIALFVEYLCFHLVRSAD